MDKNQKKKKILSHKAVMGLKRKAFFESGGDLASWRGRPSVHVDKKKKNNKKACRRFKNC